jgi:hypothetical protein
MTETAHREDELLVFDSEEDFMRHFEQERWIDGLPMVPPTAERVEAMLAKVSTSPDESLGTMPPRWRPAFLHHVAVNAVMAGCRPEYFPVVVAGVRAALDRRLNLYGVQGTTNPAGVMLVVNGPIRTELDINSGHNLFGQGWPANATIGRALRLCLITIGGGIPELGDMSTLGNPNKYGSCIAENEEASPWIPYHVEKGFDAADSVVTAAGVTAPQNIAILSEKGWAILDGIAHALLSSGSNLVLFDAEPLVVIGPVHATHLDRDGFDRDSVREYLWEHGKIPLVGLDETDYETIKKWKKSCVVTDGGVEYLRPTRHPSEIGIVVAGGLAGPHSAVLQPFNATKLVSVAVERSRM